MFVKLLHQFIEETYGVGRMDNSILAVLNTFALWLQNQDASLSVVVCTCKKPIATTSTNNQCGCCGKPRR